MKTVMTSQRVQQWTTPTVSFRGTVGQILQGGGGKLSVAAADPGEYKCEKPHCPPSGTSK